MMQKIKKFWRAWLVQCIKLAEMEAKMNMLRFA